MVSSTSGTSSTTSTGRSSSSDLTDRDDRAPGAPGGGVAPPAGPLLSERLAPLVVFLPGFLLGVQLGGLLFFLNPDLPFEPGPVARAALVYGLLVSLPVGLLALPFVLGRPRRALRLLPWGISIALGLAALLDSSHASYFAYYLPSGINERLVKAAFWLALAALVAFYTALLHSLHERPYGVRSRLVFWLLVLASVYLMVERREAFSPSPEAARPTGIEVENRPVLMVVGVDSATLDAVLPLAEQGRLPFFSRMLREGAYGRLASFSPTRPAATWSTVATGKYPYRHGVMGSVVYPAGFLAEGAELRLIPAGIGFELFGLPGLRGRPEAASRVRRARALWEVLPLLGVRTGTIGWPATDVTAPGPEFAFEDRFFGETFNADAARPLELAERAWMFRVGVEELDPRHLGRFETDAPPAVLAAMAGDAWRQSLTRVLVDQGRARAVFVRVPGLGEVSSRFFGGYAQRRLAGRQGAELDRAVDILGGYYSQLDAFLAELWAEGSGPRLLAVVSASGVDEPGALEAAVARLRGRSPLAGDLGGGADGMMFLLGEGIRAETLVTGAGLVDVAPTLLYGLGLPVARDLDGRLLVEVFEREFLDTHPITFVPSYETLERRGRPAPPESAERSALTPRRDRHRALGGRGGF